MKLNWLMANIEIEISINLRKKQQKPKASTPIS
jgi:hypothetical protein